jgi:hypothetical protein
MRPEEEGAAKRSAIPTNQKDIMREQDTKQAIRLNADGTITLEHRIADESERERWRRLYREPGGPLVGWLLDEAARRGMKLAALAQELAVTAGYLLQLRSGLREASNVSRDFAAASGVFLGVPAVVVMVVAGQLQLVDFVCATDFDRWAESTVEPDGATPVQLACGRQIGAEELRLLPLMVKALQASASVHETRARVS